MSRPSSDLPVRAVRAAIELANANGVRSVTFDAVSAQLGVSKGAVLHHFRTKGDLIEAMVQVLVSDHRAALEEACAADPEPVGRFARALLQVTSPAQNRAERGLLSALLDEPERADAMREHWRWCHARLQADGVSAMTAALIMLTSDGHWLSELIGLPQFPEPAMSQTLDWLDALTRTTAAPTLP